MKRWTESDFDSLSWHDNPVHGLEIRAFNADEGTCDLVLDIDHILQWLPPVEGFYSFRVAPAHLTFHAVFGLRIEIDYARVTAGMTPFSIGNIRREGNRWTIEINWPAGTITFDARGFTQELTGESVVATNPVIHRP